MLELCWYPGGRRHPWSWRLLDNRRWCTVLHGWWRWAETVAHRIHANSAVTTHRRTADLKTFVQHYTQQLQSPTSSVQLYHKVTIALILSIW